MFLQPMPIMADRISTLPDSILCHILSYLPTKQAVATSILSKRWRPLWLSVPTLDFDFRGYSQNRETYSRFIHLVYTAMLLRDGSQPIKRLSLECTSSSFCDPSMVNTVVTVATKRNVEHLYLVLPSTISLPSSVLTSRTLVVLNLKKLNVCLAPSSVDLPSLKTLHLTKVRFAEQAYLCEILSACPTLEVLLMKFLRFDNELSGGDFKHLPKLVKADISNSKYFLPFEALYNVERLRADVWLTSEAQYSFLNLTCVELIFQHYCWEWLIDLLCGCPRLQNLVIIEKNEYSEADSDWLQPHSVPQCLNTQLKTLCVRKYGGKESELRFTSYIMQNARALRSVTICSTRYSNLEEKNEMMKKLLSLPRSSPTCQLFFE